MTRYLNTLLSALLACLISAPVYSQTVGSDDIQKGAVRSKHIKNKTVMKKDLKGRLTRKLLFASYRFVDSNGKVLGPMVDENEALMTLTPDNVLDLSAPDVAMGDQVVVNLLRDGFGPGLSYTGDNCTGEVVTYPWAVPVVPETENGPSPGPFPPAGQMTGYIIAPGAPPTPKVVESEYWIDNAGNPACLDVASHADNFVPMVPVLNLTIYTPPFRLERVK